MYHKYTNILGMDDNVCYGHVAGHLRPVLEELQHPYLIFNTLLPFGFESGCRLAACGIGEIVKRRLDHQEAWQRIG